MFYIFKILSYKIERLYWNIYYKYINIGPCFTIGQLHHCLDLLKIYDFKYDIRDYTFTLEIKIFDKISIARRDSIYDKLKECLPVGIKLIINIERQNNDNN